MGPYVSPRVTMGSLWVPTSPHVSLWVVRTCPCVPHHVPRTCPCVPPRAPYARLRAPPPPPRDRARRCHWCPAGRDVTVSARVAGAALPCAPAVKWFKGKWAELGDKSARCRLRHSVDDDKVSGARGGGRGEETPRSHMGTPQGAHRGPLESPEGAITDPIEAS